METLLNAAATVPGLLAALTLVSMLRFLSHILEYLWQARMQKDTKVQRALETLATALRQNNDRLKMLELTLATAARTKIDVRRLYAIVKILAGDDWDAIRAQALKDEQGDDAA